MFNITGTTTITAIASSASWDGRVVTLIFAAALTLTHSSNLALPGSVNITTAANDVATFVQTASGAWRCTAYTVAANGAYLPLAGGSLTGVVITTVAGTALQTRPTAETTFSGVNVASAAGARRLELIYVGTGSAAVYGVAPGGVGINAGATGLVLSVLDTAAISIASTRNVAIAAPSSGTALSVAAVSGALAAIYTAGPVRHQVTTVGSLLAAATAGAGAVAFVTDATATTFASIVAGGGANGVPCYSDGTNWRIG